MEHLDPDVLAAMADGRLSSRELAQAERHISACASCRKELSALAGMSAAAETVKASPRERKLDPSEAVVTSIRPSRAIATSARIAMTTAASQSALVLREKLGEGGMAVVYVAVQTALGREVAVKTARDGDLDAARALVDEARITGALEHPNIVPVHDVGRDDQGRPLIVLKRIEGTPWSETIATAKLEWNLEQLVHVCRAVAFAHSRGILHRDLKPANVMVGEFGETYVLDWGIALPVDSHNDEVAGTLAYMAPEMLAAEVLTVRADVYLLGATLYEIVAGEPPHVAPSITASMLSIARSQP